MSQQWSGDAASNNWFLMNLADSIKEVPQRERASGPLIVVVCRREMMLVLDTARAILFFGESVKAGMQFGIVQKNLN